MVKADGSVLIHSDGGSYKPLNWMNPPLTMHVQEPAPELAEEGVTEVWRLAAAKSDDTLTIHFHQIEHDSAHELGTDPGLIKDGVEADLQRLLAEQIDLLGDGHTLIRREYMTAIGPVDILARDGAGATVAVELKRRGDIDGVEQLTRYLELLNRDPLLKPVTGIFAAQQINRRPARWPRTAASAAWCSTTTRCAAWTIRPGGCSRLRQLPATGRATKARQPFTTAIPRHASPAAKSIASDLRSRRGSII